MNIILFSFFKIRIKKLKLYTNQINQNLYVILFNLNMK